MPAKYSFTREANPMLKSTQNGSYATFTVIVFLLFMPFTAAANFDFNANCLKAYQNIFALKINTARQLIAIEKKARPNNAIVPLLENYVDYFYLLTNESKSEFERLEANKSARLDQISKDDKSSPYYLYAQAEINLQWALIRGRYGSYYTASKEINRANSLLKENGKKFPNFHLNQKGLGFINVVIGALPDGLMKSTLSRLGIKGDVQTGLKQLDQLAENLPKSAYEPFYEEVIFYYAYLLSDVAKSPSAYAKTMKYTARIADSSLLKSYMQAYVSMRNGKNSEAISVLLKRPAGNIYQPFPYLDYLLGVAQLNKLDTSAANASFSQFLKGNKGDNYIKDTYLHLAWIALLRNDTNTYSAYIKRTKSNGSTYNDKDKQALNEANAATPHVLLLKARLLFDGGYLTKAAAVLAISKADQFTSVRDKTEYYYRMGRIHDNLEQYKPAIANYQLAIASGRNLKDYFAANSALLLGKMYEEQNNNAKARSAYQTAIGMKNHDYESSIKNDAKLGLRRTGG